MKVVNLDNFKLRLNKYLHNNSVLFETQKLTSLQTKPQPIASEELRFI